MSLGVFLISLFLFPAQSTGHIPINLMLSEISQWIWWWRGREQCTVLTERELLTPWRPN